MRYSSHIFFLTIFNVSVEQHELEYKNNAINVWGIHKKNMNKYFDGHLAEQTKKSFQAVVFYIKKYHSALGRQ